MAHTIKIDLPNRPQGEMVQVGTLGAGPNGSVLELSDEQAAIWQYQNPGQQLPTEISDRAAVEARVAAVEAMTDEEREAYQEAVNRQWVLDLSKSAPSTPDREGEQ